VQRASRPRFSDLSPEAQARHAEATNRRTSLEIAGRLAQIAVVSLERGLGMFREKGARTGGSMLSKAKLEQIAKVLEGIPVLGCLEGSPSERAGIRYGDVVLSVNGVKTSDMDLYLKARELRSDGAEIVVFRNGVEVVIELVFENPSSVPTRPTGARVA
jgi:S1-C subfamily serine protease